MPLEIIRNDITKMSVDAIVNATNHNLLASGGVDKSIHVAAGEGLSEECKKLGGCKTGEAKITLGYKLPCKYIIHTVGPVWHGGLFGEKRLLTACYLNSLNLAKDNDCRSIAFPIISSGSYRYPKDKALKVAIDVISDFLLENEMQVYIVVYDKALFSISEKLFSDIKQFIDDKYVEERTPIRRQSFSMYKSHKYREDYESESRFFNEAEVCDMLPCSQATCACATLEQMLSEIDESFSQMLLRKIDEKGMTDAQCYKKANIDRKLFSKIRKDIHYKPKKTTALAFAVSLELSLEETKEMLNKAGFSLSHSNKFDIIIEYFIMNNNYNIFEINEALFAFDQSLLGG